MKKRIRKLLRCIRWMIGTEQQQAQLDWQRQQLEQHRQLLLEVLSLLKYSIIDTEQVKLSTTYKRCGEIISLLVPMDVRGGKYVRIGRDYDGGYVMLDTINKKSVDVAYSFGIGNDVSWDEAIADRGIDVFMFDHTIDELPKTHSKFSFSKTGVTGYSTARNLKTLATLLSSNNHATHMNMIMKMDIEGYEWDVFDEASTDTINQFSQIVVELHGLCQIQEDRRFLYMVNTLKKINLTHQCIHVHANISCIPLWIGGKVLPDLLEVTYIRRADVKEELIHNTRSFPTCLDRPTIKGLPDLDLGYFGK